MGKLFLQDFLCLLWALKPGSCSGYEYHQSNLLWASPIPGFNRWNSQIPSDFTNLTLCLCRVREWNSFWKRFLWCQSQCWDTPLQSSGTLSEALLNLFFFNSNTCWQQLAILINTKYRDDLHLDSCSVVPSPPFCLFLFLLPHAI